MNTNNKYVSIVMNVSICAMTLIKDTTDYLTEVAGLYAAAKPLRPRHLPVFIVEQYDFYTLKLGALEVLGVALQDTTDPLVVRALAEEKEAFSPAALAKHQVHFPVKENGFVLIARRLENFTRKRLIDMKVPFVVPHVQLYWPTLGLEVRKRNQESVSVKGIDTMAPAEQAVVMGIMNDIFPTTFQPKELERILGYNLMSMTRAVKILEGAGLGKSVKKGVNRLFTPLEKHDLWKQALPHFKNPVRNTVRLEEHDMRDEAKILAGESALARISMLGAPRTPTYAVARDQWRRLQSKAISYLTTEEPGTCAVQVWRYDPALFAKDGAVDVFSLYLSLKDSHDERVAMALEEAMKDFL